MNKYSQSELDEGNSSEAKSYTVWDAVWLFFLVSLFVLQGMAFRGIWDFAVLADKLENPGWAGKMLNVLATPAVGILALAAGIILYIMTIIYGEHWQIFYILYSAIIFLVAFALCSIIALSMIGAL